MGLEGTLLRCPHCIAAIPGQELDPGKNVCPRCLREFDAAQVIVEDYGKRGAGRKAGWHWTAADAVLDPRPGFILQNRQEQGAEMQYGTTSGVSGYGYTPPTP